MSYSANQKGQWTWTLAANSRPDDKTLECFNLVLTAKWELLEERYHQHLLGRWAWSTIWKCETHFDLGQCKISANTNSRAAQYSLRQSIDLQTVLCSHPSLNVRSSCLWRIWHLFLSNQRSGRKIWASGPQTLASWCITFRGIARRVPFGIMIWVSLVPGNGSSRGILIISEAWVIFRIWSEPVRW